MPQLDRIKEELGWLKVVFTIAVATDLSLMGYLAQNFNAQSITFSIINILSILIITVFIVIINKKAYKKIDEIGEL